MQKYSHDYTLPQKADQLLREAQVKIKWNNYYDAEKKIGEARELLQKYLAQDNMVPDDEAADGWVRSSEIEPVTFQVGYSGKNLQDMLRTSAERHGIERHGQIDRQYKKQLDGVGDPACPLYGKKIRITGTFDELGMSRDDVAAACQRLGAAEASEGICKSMDVFIVGSKPGPSKLKQVEQLRADGHDIRILSQIEFKEIISKYSK